MTWNKDRKQTKYGHKRQEQMTHTTEPWHNSPLPEGVSHAVTVPPGRGGWALWRPLRTDMDRNTGRGPPERNRQTKEAMAELGAQEAMAELGAQEAMAVQGAQEAMAGGPCGRGLGPLGPAPTAGTLLPPHPTISLGKLGGIRSPPGLNRQDSPLGLNRQGQDSPPGLNRQGQDRTAHRNRKPSWAGLEAEASSGHDEESGALTGSLSNRFHFGDRRLEWPPWPQQEEPPAPDESLWTWQDKLKCSCGHNQTYTRHSWPCCGQDPRG